MNEGVNSVLISGFLAWPELRYTTTGKPLFRAKLKVSVTDERQQEQNFGFVRITAWEDIAEYLASLPEETPVRVSARIQERSYVDKNGQKRNVVDLVVTGVEEATDQVGENHFYLEGELRWPELRYVGPNNTAMYRAKVRIPFIRDDGRPSNAYVRILAWGPNAESLGTFPEGTAMQLAGYIQERSWTSPKGEKRTFVDAVVTEFGGLSTPATQGGV